MALSTVTRALDVLRGIMNLLSYPVWLLDDQRGLPSTHLLSPYVVCSARKLRLDLPV
jgi:hypothetical protein